jgi:putative chitinase
MPRRSLRSGRGWAARAPDLVGKPQALANAAYAGHLGNGDEASGDGWRFRGRGIFQLTGRANYAAAGAALRADLVANPDLLIQPRYAVDSALWFWKIRGCSDDAMRDDVEAVTRKINGSGMAGLEERRLLTERAKAIFHDGGPNGT